MKFQNTGDKDSSKFVWDGGGGFIIGSKILQTGKLQTRRPWNNKIKLFANQNSIFSQTIKYEDRLKAFCICKSSKILSTMYPFLRNFDKKFEKIGSNP